MPVTLRALFKGRVQGVGFRWTVQDHAERLQLAGTVENLPDGSVEVFASGPRPALEAFLKAIQEEPGPAQIQNVETSYLAKHSAYSQFTILH